MATSCAGARLVPGSLALDQVVGGGFLLHHGESLDIPTSKCILLPHKPHWKTRDLLEHPFLSALGLHQGLRPHLQGCVQLWDLQQDMELLEQVQRRPWGCSEGWSPSALESGWEGWGWSPGEKKALERPENLFQCLKGYKRPGEDKAVE
ncbi:hypothetical protein DUI87_09570 [Hirundo rustica rustica]|uniref:Uncharacterized protein n=1 Tax=Hirundo rustica rustica TaxID=333673 RepID=A0A3M0KSW8_HIRRU|nr:hypothetical protein DUI87_09570 [Hirundo rustica rustica]